MIENAVSQIAKKEGVYIPPNLHRGVRISFHIDNFNEQILTFDGKNTVHYLLIVGFQQKKREAVPIKLDLKETVSLTLDENTNRQFQGIVGCKNVHYVMSRSPTLFTWQCLRNFEHLFSIGATATYISDQFISNVASCVTTNETLNVWDLNSICLPSYSATNSLVVDVDVTRTNVFSFLFVAGPASSISAVYTAIDMAHKIGEASESIGTDEEKECAVDTLLRPINAPSPWKTIIVLDLDLHEKAYLIVHSRKDLRDRYLLCLGELHIISAEIRAIGNFINSSGLDDAWMGANWFDSECLLWQVKQCPNMKRAIATHETTFIAISIVLLEATLLYFENQTI